MASTSVTKQDNGRVLGLGDLFGIAIGTVIGAGVMTMTGIAIGITGRSVNIAFMIAAVLSVISSIPPIFISGTANFHGGQYSQIGILSGKYAGGIFNYLNIALAFSSTLTAMSFTQYFLSLVPGVNGTLVSVLVVTALCLINAVAVKSSSRMQNIMVAVLIVAIAAYVAFGIPNVQPGYFKGPDFMTNGSFGLMHASMYLTMSLGGATYVVNYSSKAKNPVRDVPIVIIGTTIGVAILYMVMATVAAGVLPIAEVANQPLSVGAKSFMSGGMYTFFVVGGAMFALITTLNASLGSKVYPFMTASVDGWLPKIFAKTNKRFGTPHYAYIALYLLIVIPIISGLDIKVVANSTVIIVTAIRVLMAFSAMNLPKVMPELWEKSRFHVKQSVLRGMCILSIFINTATVLFLIFTKSMNEIIGNLVILGITVVLTFLAHKRVTMTASYQDV